MNETEVQRNEYQGKLRYTVFLLTCVISSTIVFIPDYPPMVDLPQHAGQIALIKSVVHSSFSFGHLFEMQILTPYWLGYSIVLALSYVFGITAATKITVALALAAFPISVDRFMQSQNGNPYWSWLFIPVSYGFAFEWGFLNFLVAIPIGFFFLERVSRLGSDYKTKDIIHLAIWCHVLFLAHALVLVVFLAIATLLRHDSNPRIWFRRIAPFFSIAPIFLIWFIIKIIKGSDTQGAGPWGLGLHRLTELFPNMVALPPTKSFMVFSVFICMAAIVGTKINLSSKKLGPFIVYLFLMLVGPNFLFGTFFVYNRFTHIGLPLFLLAFTSNKTEIHEQTKIKYVNLLVVSISLILFGYHSAKMSAYSNESLSFQKIVDYIPPDKRILSLVFTRNSDFYAAPVYLHYPVWYQAEKRGVVDFNFAYFFPQVIRYKEEMRPPSDPNFVWFPHMFDWDNFEKFQYSYFIVKHPDDLSQKLFPRNEAELVEKSGDWRLYKTSAIASKESQ